MEDCCSSDDENKKLLVNWNLIDDNLLELIAKRLDAMDYIRFRAVCKTWRAISIIPQRRLLPWLITGWDRVDGRLFYISFTDDKLHSIVVPALKGYKSSSVELGMVSCQGWLVLEGQLDNNSYAISLLNPLTGAHVHLPEAPKQLFTRRVQYNMTTTNYTEIQYLIHQMVISSSPLSMTDCTIVVISAGNKALVSLRNGSSWLLMSNQSKYEDVVSFNKCFAAVNCLGEVSMFSAITLNKLYTIPSPSRELNKADWKLASMSHLCLILFHKVSDFDRYISFKDKKLPFYKTRWVNVYKLFRDDGVAPPPARFGKVICRHSVVFYGISSYPYLFVQFFSGMPECIYMAGEQGEMPDDDELVSYVTMPQAFDIKNGTLKPLLPQVIGTNSISFFHVPQLF